MIEVLDVLMGAGVAWVSMAVGARRERGRAPKPPKQAICQCTHGYALHDAEGVCHGSDSVMVREGKPILSPWGTYVVARSGAEYQAKPCVCKRYTGLEPLPQVVAY